MYVGETLADIVLRAEQAAGAQLSTVFEMPLDHPVEYAHVFAIKLEQLKAPCGGDLEVPRGR